MYVIWAEDACLNSVLISEHITWQKNTFLGGVFPVSSAFVAPPILSKKENMSCMLSVLDMQRLLYTSLLPVVCAAQLSIKGLVKFIQGFKFKGELFLRPRDRCVQCRSEILDYLQRKLTVRTL